MRARSGRRTTPFSVTRASTRAAGVRSKTGFQAPAPGAATRRPPTSSSSPGGRSSIGIALPSGHSRSTLLEGATTMKPTRWWRAPSAREQVPILLATSPFAATRSAPTTTHPMLPGS